MIEDPFTVFVILLLGNLVQCIDFQTSSYIANSSTESTYVNMTCSATETNIHALFYLKLSTESSLFVGSEDKTTSRVIAVVTASGTILPDNLPLGLRNVDVTGHINNTDTSDSRLTVGFDLLRVPCGHYNEVYTCEIYYQDPMHKTVKVNASKTLCMSDLAVNLTEDSRDSSMYVLSDANSWLEGFSACEREHNASREDHVYKLPENKTFIAELVNIHGSLWTYGLEVIFHQNGKTKAFQINRRNPNLPAVGVCSLEDRVPDLSIDPNRSYTETETACHEANTSIPIVTPTNITLYASDIMVGSSFWVAYINEESYLNDQGIDVRCLLYDSNGDIKTDDCKSKHKTLCVTEYTMPVVKYVDNVTLPRLRTVSSKGTSTSIYNTQGSKNTNDKKLSSSSRTKKDSNEAGPSISAIIGGVIGAIACVRLILLAVCCLCCRHWNTKDKREGNIELLDKKDTESEVKDDGSANYNISEPAQYENLGGGTGVFEYTSLSRPELDVSHTNEPVQYECLDGGNSVSEYTSLSRPELGADENNVYENNTYG